MKIGDGFQIKKKHGFLHNLLKGDQMGNMNIKMWKG